MNNKKGDVFSEELVKIVAAVLGLFILFYLGYSLFNLSQDKIGIENQKELLKDQVFPIIINNEPHSLTLIEIKEASVTILVKSTPFNLNLNVGETKKIDINEDGTYDLEIKLISVDLASNKVIVELIALSEKTKIPEKSNEDTGNLEKILNRDILDSFIPPYGEKKELALGKETVGSGEIGGMLTGGSKTIRQIIINPGGYNPCAGKPDLTECRYFAEQNMTANVQPVAGTYGFKPISNGVKSLCCDQLCIVGAPVNCCGNPAPERGVFCFNYVISTSSIAD